MSVSVLLVDDDDLVRAVLERAARAEGYTVTSACNGHEALAWLGRATFDLVVTDLKMPGITGFDVIQATRAQNPGARIIVVSGFVESVEEEALVRAGIVCLRKPFGTRDFKAAMEQALSS